MLIWKKVPRHSCRPFAAAVFALVFSLGLGSLAQARDLTLLPRCGGRYGLCGYVQSLSGGKLLPYTVPDGPVAIAFNFEEAKWFSEGLAAVRIRGRFGYIDKRGTVIIPPRFDAAGEFRGGYAEVRINGASGIIDRRGRVVISAQFERILPFTGKTFIAQPLSPRSSRRLDVDLSPLTENFSLYPEGTAGLYWLDRGWKTSQNFSFAKFGPPERGLIWAAQRAESGEALWGLIRTDGSWQITPRYSHVQQLLDNRAVVRGRPDGLRWGDRRSHDDPSGAVDENGQLKVPLVFPHLSYWRGGYGLAFDKSPFSPTGQELHPRKGIVRPDGSLLGGRYFDDVEIGADGTLPRALVGNEWSSVTPEGQLVSDQANGRTVMQCPGGLTLRQRGSRTEFSHPARATPIGAFDNKYFQSRDCAGPIPVQSQGRWGYVTQDGRYLGGANGFENTFSFSGGYAAVKLDGKWGVIDVGGRFTVKPQFDDLHPDQGVFRIGRGEPGHWVDGTGKNVPRPTDPRANPRRLLDCGGGIELFDRNGRWGLREVGGKTVIEPKYRVVSCFANGVAWAVRDDRKIWCPIAPDGEFREDLGCRQYYYFQEWTDSHPEQFASDPFESNVLWNRAYLDYASGRRPEPPKWISDFGGATSRGAGPAGTTLGTLEQGAARCLALLGALGASAPPTTRSNRSRQRLLSAAIKSDQNRLGDPSIGS
ncbi:MAG: WG repeat-containing protein [Hyphomicrobiaceae bacterium]